VTVKLPLVEQFTLTTAALAGVADPIARTRASAAANNDFMLKRYRQNAISWLRQSRS